VQEWQQAGWLGTTQVGVHIPNWIGTWFATFPTAEGLVFQALALAFVVSACTNATSITGVSGPISRPRSRCSWRRCALPPVAAPAACLHEISSRTEGSLCATDS